MSRTPDYTCTRCGKRPGVTQTESRDLLTVKKVMFLELGEGGKVLRSRVVDWLCPKCVASDDDYRREPFQTPNNNRAPFGAVRG